MWRLGPERFERASVEVVKEELRAGGWPVYKSYAIEIEDGEAFVVAPVSWASLFNPEPLEEKQGWQRLRSRRRRCETGLTCTGCLASQTTIRSPRITDLRSSRSTAKAEVTT